MQGTHRPDLVPLGILERPQRLLWRDEGAVLWEASRHDADESPRRGEVVRDVQEVVDVPQQPLA